MLYFLGIIFLGFVLMILISEYEHRCIDITEYNINSDKLSEDINGYKFAVISDLHNNDFGNKGKKLVDKIDSLNPQFILIAGDMIVKRKSCFEGIALELIKDLANRYQIYYGFGNHETYASIYDESNFANYKAILESCGVIFLDNDKSTINIKNNKFNLYGLNFSLDYYGMTKKEMNIGDMNALIGRAELSEYNILIAHNPDYFENYMEWGADLILSGHLHGGIMVLPILGGSISPRYGLFPKYYGGKFTKDNGSMIVSRGMGTHTIRLRLFNKPELLSIVFNKSN